MSGGIGVKYGFLILLLCSAAYAASCPTGEAKDEAALVQMEQRWARALEAHDVPALDCILGSDFEEAGPTGQLADRSAMLTRAAHGQNAHYELSELHAHVYVDFAYIRGVGVATGAGGQLIAKTRFTDIFVYRHGRWQCVAGHESLFPAPAH
jgi:ketosteroid isomerase-like protein